MASASTLTEALAKESGQLKVEHYDRDIDPAKAKELGASANGSIVFVRGGRKEQSGKGEEFHFIR